MHSVLEHVALASPDGDEIDRLASSLATGLLRRGVEEGAALAAQLVKDFLASPAGAWLRDAQEVRREVEFLLPWPPRDSESSTHPAVLRGYLDALVRDADGRWTVLDYKTNQATAAEVPRLAERYRLQLMVYAHAAHAALGEPLDTLRLAFLQPAVTHDFVWDDAARRASIPLIDDAIAEARTAAAAQP